MAEQKTLNSVEHELMKRARAKEDLVKAMKGILMQGIASKVLEDPSKLVWEDIEISPHLHACLGAAFVAVGELGGYLDRPKGY